MRCDAGAKALLAGVPGADVVDAAEADWSEEYLAPIISIKLVDSLDEAIAHINRYGSHHTDAILTHEPRARDALPARGRFGQRDGQCQHALRRRLRVRPGRRDRHQHRQVPRPRAGGPGRPDLAEVGGAGPGRDPHVGTPAASQCFDAASYNAALHKTREPAMPTASKSPVLVDLALQGGGAHGAFTWGVLDRLLEEPWLTFDGISGTSAGAMNAAVMASGHAHGGADGAKAALEDLLEARLRRLAVQPDAARPDGDAHRPVDAGQLADVPGRPR